MPRKRRILKGRNKNFLPLNDSTAKVARTGHDFFSVFGKRGGMDDPPMPELREFWNEYRRDILATHIAEQPCTRPWAWWKFEHAECELSRPWHGTFQFFNIDGVAEFDHLADHKLLPAIEAAHLAGVRRQWLAHEAHVAGWGCNCNARPREAWGEAIAEAQARIVELREYAADHNIVFPEEGTAELDKWAALFDRLESGAVGAANAQPLSEITV